jgi:hypothetical protein
MSVPHTRIRRAEREERTRRREGNTSGRRSPSRWISISFVRLLLEKGGEEVYLAVGGLLLGGGGLFGGHDGGDGWKKSEASKVRGCWGE